MPKPPAAPAAAPPPKFEDALAQIEQIIERIESGDSGLEDALAEYEKGVALIQHCRHTLDKARKKVEDLTAQLEAAADDESPESDEAEQE